MDQITMIEVKRTGPVPDPRSLLISTLLHTVGFLHTCPYSQTLEVYSSKLRCTVWIALPCKLWKCRFCAPIKVSSLARKTEAAKPNRLLTLTVDPKKWDDPRAAYDGTRRKLSDLIKPLRKQFGEVEYLRVTELTKGGWPHYHLLVRSAYLPHESVKETWSKLTGATIVDLRQVKNRFQTYTYLVKYLTKMHNIGWTDRHVSYSKNFFPKAPEDGRVDLELTEAKVIETHPAVLLYNQFRHATLVELAYGVFALNPPEDVVNRAKLAHDEPDDPVSEKSPLPGLDDELSANAGVYTQMNMWDNKWEADPHKHPPYGPRP